MLKFFEFLFTYLSKPQNAGMTFAALCLFSFGWLNMKQTAEHYRERAEWKTELWKKDSVSNKQREDLVLTIRDLRRDILECSRESERLRKEIEIIKKKH